MPSTASARHHDRVTVEREIAVQILCPACGAVLRRVAGLHYAGEPPAAMDERGRLIRCLRCGAEYRDAGTMRQDSDDKRQGT